MAATWLQGFFFEVEKWFASTAQQRMSFAEKGVYLVMLFQEWRDRSRSLPDDPSLVADLIAVTDSQRQEIVEAWDTVRKKFVADRRTPEGRMFNAALERTRRQQRASWLKKVKAGRSGGNASAGKRLEDNAEVAQQCLSDAQRSSTDKKRKEKKGSKNPPTPLAGGRIRVNRRERAIAERIRHNRCGCPHDPRHESAEPCIVAIVAEIREKAS